MVGDTGLGVFFATTIIAIMDRYFAKKTPDPIGCASFVGAFLMNTAVAFAQQPQPLIKRVDDATRAKVLAALAGLVILGFGLVLLAWLGARLTQRYRQGTSYFRPTARPGEHDWAKKPLIPGDTKTDRKR